MLLLRHNTAAFSVLHTVQRSLHSSHLVLPNDTFLPITSSNGTPLSPALTQLLDEILLPLRRITVSEAEVAFLKALLLLSPDVTGLTASSRLKLQDVGLLLKNFIC